MVLGIVIILSALIVIIDQVIKYFIYSNLSPDGRVTIIDGLLSFVYSENKGAAFGIFQNATLIFAVITIALIAVFLFLLITKRFSGKLFTASIILIIGGGIGNLWDRLFRGFVIDYISFSFFPPICNFADYCITIGAALFILSIILLPESKEKSRVSEGDSDDE